MAILVNNRVQETCSAPGTGTVTLLGAVSQYRSFSAGIGSNNLTYYVIADQTGTNWEVGIGTVGSTGTTLARTIVLDSSNGGSLTNFSSGTQAVWVDYPANAAVLQTDVGTASNQIPLNQYLGSMAYEDKNGINILGGNLSGLMIPIQPTPTALTASGTLTTAQIQSQIIQVTSATAVTLTMPTGATIDGAIVPLIGINTAIDFFLINTGSASGAITVAVATGVTSIGSLTLAIGTSAHFRLQRTATNTYILYRLV